MYTRVRKWVVAGEKILCARKDVFSKKKDVYHVEMPEFVVFRNKLWKDEEKKETWNKKDKATAEKKDWFVLTVHFHSHRKTIIFGGGKEVEVQEYPYSTISRTATYPSI